MLPSFSALVLLTVSTAHAELVRVPFDPPIETVPEILEEIERHESTAQCGGWNYEVSMESTIPAVAGVPGREWIWDGNILSHTAQRVENRDTAIAFGDEQAAGIFSDGFLFPHTNEVLGFSTTCRAEDLAAGPFPNPERLQNCRTPEECTLFCRDLNQWQRPICLDRQGRQMPTRCILNARGGVNGCAAGAFQGWQYCCSRDLLGNAVPVTDHDFTIDPTVSGQGSAHPDANRNCTVCRGDGAGNSRHFQNDKDFNADSTDRIVRDEMGCRWGKEILPIADPPLDPADREIDEDAEHLPAVALNQYQSFFRQFTGSHRRQPTKKAVLNHPRDRFAVEDIQIACYGPYQEYDPKRTTAMVEDPEEIAGEDADRIQGPVPRCVIGKDYSPMRDTQNNVQRQGIDPFEEIDQPERPFNEEEDLWAPIGGALSLLNGEVFEQDYDNDLLLAVTAVDQAELRTTVQQTEDVPLSQARLIRAYDQTVDRGRIFTADPDQREHSRTYPEWVQWTQTQMSRLLRPPVMRVIFPTTWVYGLHPSNHPLSQLESIAQQGLQQGPNRSVELQLGIRPSALDWVAQTIKDLMLLRVSGEPVPVHLPLIDPVEMATAAENWCLYVIEQTGETADCTDVPGEIGAFVTDLFAYADAAQKIFDLREELPMVLTELLRAQREIAEPVDRWLTANMDAFEEIASQITERQAFIGKQDAELAEEGEEIEEESIAQLWEDFSMHLLAISDTASLSWCKNDGLLPEIFSSLDAWLPGRPELTGLRVEFEDCIRSGSMMEQCLEEVEGLPIFDVGPPQDIVIDLTAIRIPSKVIKIPVFQPTQVALEIPTPRREKSIEEQEIIQLPPIDDLEIPTAQEILSQIVPETRSISEPATITSLIPDPERLQDMQVTMEDIRLALERSNEILEELYETEDRFYSSIMPPRQAAPLGCETYDDAYCFRSEMDLREQLARLGAPPGFIRRADLRAVGPELERPLDERNAVLRCTEEQTRDWTCMSVPSRMELPREGWQVRLEGQQDPIEEYRMDVFELTLPMGEREQEEIYPYRLNRDSKERTRHPLMQSFTVPEEFELILQYDQ